MATLAPAEIQALARVLDELDYYQLLEISRNAALSEVKRSYYASSRRFHPDAHRALEGTLREAIERIAKRIAEAYSVLRDPRLRRAYDKRLAVAETHVRLQLTEAADLERAALEERVGSTPKGRRFFLMAQADLERGDLASAARNLQMARTFEPQNALFEAKLEEIREALQRG